MVWLLKKTKKDRPDDRQAERHKERPTGRKENTCQKERQINNYATKAKT